MTVQYIIVFVILAAAAGYAAHRIFKALRQPPTATPTCAGCPMADLCKDNKTRNHTKMTCKKKK